MVKSLIEKLVLVLPGACIPLESSNAWNPKKLIGRVVKAIKA